MKRKRRHLTAEFKARIAFEALKEERTIQQIAIDEDVAPTQISAWKKELQERMGELFERKNAASETEKKANSRPPSLSARSANLLSRRNFSKKSACSWGSI